MSDLQELCERGQRLLEATDYLGAEDALVEAEHTALESNDFDTLSRLYMPLQEARRQRRQRCGEGIVKLDLIARSADETLDPAQIVETFPHGQLLVAGWGSLDAAIRVRALQRDRNLYAETFLAASYRSKDGVEFVVLAPERDSPHPSIDRASNAKFDEVVEQLPDYCWIFRRDSLPTGERRGNPQTFADVMSKWEQLHRPFLQAADATKDARQKIEAYRRTIRVDYACELAHQQLSAVAHELARNTR